MSDPALIRNPAILEAAVQAVRKAAGGDLGERDSQLLATAVLAAVTPLIRADALEEAIKAIESALYADTRDEAIDVLRALKEQP